MAPSKNQDRISSLPDVIIGEILSLIPTRQAVATSILSRRWQYLWTLIKNLDFECLNEDDDTAFVKFVDTVFSKSTTRELEKLYLLSFVTLTSLRFHNDLETTFNAPDSIYLPNLKVLEIGFPNKLIGFVQKLVSHCPAMECFSIGTEVGSQETFVISLPLLKRLEMDTSSSGYDEIGYTLVIDAPELLYLEITARDHVPSYLIKIVPSEVETIIDVGDWDCFPTEKDTLCIVELLNQLNEVKSLTLLPPTLRYLWDFDLEMLPIFNKLFSLKLEIYGGSEIISYLLQASPSLEVFMIEMYGDEVDHDFEIQWIEPEYVPACLSSSLSVFKIEWPFEEDDGQELEMMKYLLGNGEVLQKFVVEAWSVYDEVEFRKKLLTFPSASRHCVVQVL